MVALAKCQWKSASCLEKAVVICEVILSVDNYKISVVVAFLPRRSSVPFCRSSVPFCCSSVPPPLYKSLILKEKNGNFRLLPYFYLISTLFLPGWPVDKSPSKATKPHTPPPPAAAGDRRGRAAQSSGYRLCVGPTRLRLFACRRCSSCCTSLSAKTARTVRWQ